MPETINKYATEAAYQADTHATSLDEVSLVTETGDVHYDGVNVIRPAGAVPEVGDALFVDSSGNKIFVSGKSKMVPSEFPAGTEFTGAVCGVFGRTVLLLHKDFQTMRMISHWTWEITGIQYNASNTIVFRQYGLTAEGASTYQYYNIGTPFMFTPTDIDDAVHKIDVWLKANPGGTDYNALIPYTYNWFCRKIDNKICVLADPNKSKQYVPDSSVTQVEDGVSIVDNTQSGNIKSICNIAELSHLPERSSSETPRRDGITTNTLITNANAFKIYNRNIVSPTDEVGSTGVYNEAGFNNSTVVKAYYGTYDAYLDAHYPVYPVNRGSISERNSKEWTVALCSTRYLSYDESEVVALYNAAEFTQTRSAHSTAHCEGLDVGDWHMPFMREYYEITRHIQNPTETHQPYDTISNTFMQLGYSNPLLNTYVWITMHDIFWAWCRRNCYQINQANMNAVKNYVWPVAWITV